MIKLRYGNTNTFYIAGTAGGLLVDTDCAGTLPLFFKAVKAAGIGVGDISRLIVTHYHPDHAGLAGELQRLGITLLAVDVQKPFMHFADRLYGREKDSRFVPVDDGAAEVITEEESRGYLGRLGIRGEIISTPSHSGDSISVLLDSGDFIVGDLEPSEHIPGYEENAGLKRDWDKIMSRRPKRIFFAHSNEKYIK